MSTAVEFRDSLRVIKHRLSSKDRMQSLVLAQLILYRDYSHGSRTKFRSPRLRGYPAPPSFF